jgi:hypothetical protein
MDPSRNRSLQGQKSAAERAATIFELYKKGATYKQAGAEVGMTTSAARRAVLRVLRGVPTHDAREQRTLMLERYQAMRLELWNIVHAPNVSSETKVAALNSLGKVESGTAEILGLKKLVVKVTDDGDKQISIGAARDILARAESANRFLEAKRVNDYDENDGNGGHSNGAAH